MTKLDQLRLEVRRLTKANAAHEARLARLESAQSAVNGQPRQTAGGAAEAPRLRYVTIPQARSDARHNIWAEYFFLKRAEVIGQFYNRKRGQHPTSKTFFAETVRVDGQRLSVREFQRWFQVRNTFPEGSAQDRKIRAAIVSEIERLRAAGFTIGRTSRGTA